MAPCQAHVTGRVLSLPLNTRPRARGDSGRLRRWSGPLIQLSVATQKSPLVAIVRLLVRGQMGQLLLPEEQVLPVSARPSRGRGLGNRRQVLHEWGPLAGHQWGFLHGHVQVKDYIAVI